MKVTLISPYEAIAIYGMRILSAVLKAMGAESQMVLLPRESEGIPLWWGGFHFTYPQAILDQVAEVAQDSDLVGITLMSNHFENAVQITEHLRRSTKAPIIWGGVHPTVRPAECLEHADLVCVGEGEEALRELVLQIANGQGYAGVRNMWYKRNGEMVRTPLRPLASDLDSYPYPDYDLSAEFVLHQGRIQPMTKDLLFHYLRRLCGTAVTYNLFMSRGCHYRCAYCGNNALASTYGGKWCARRRSVPHVIGELKQIVTRFPEIEYVQITDDLFLDDVEKVREFSNAYRQAIGLPFVASGFHPATVDEERIRLLVDAGMNWVSVGIQTGSMRVMHQVYRRACTLKQITQTFEVLHKFTDRIEPPAYQFILDNPWETEEDQMETLRMLLRVPKPFQLYLFSLTCFPGTELYERAKSEGLVTNDLTQVYRKHYHWLKHTYVNGLFRLFQSQVVPHWLIALLMFAPLRRLNWIEMPERILRLCYFLVRVRRSGRRLLHGDGSPVRSVLSKTFLSKSVG